MNVGLIDVDGHNFPNLALMRISAYHKAQGDNVEWWLGDLFHYDLVYKSKVFSDAYSKDTPDPVNCDKVIKGGTGYCISLRNGVEVYDKSKDTQLPPEIEKMFPDYSIYPQYGYAVSMTSRGCPRGCSFCHVAAKEGRRSVKVADVPDFWNGQKEIKVLDPNITACKDKRELFRQYLETKAYIDFTQGLDIRLLNEDDIQQINKMRIKEIHFAWDNPNDDLEDKFRSYAKKAKHKPHGSFGTVYCLTNYGNYTTQEHVQMALHRIYALRDMGFDPYCMIYNKTEAPQEVRHLQRWCNNKKAFRSVERYEDFDFRRA